MRSAEPHRSNWQRRDVLKAGLALAGGAALISIGDQASAASTTVNMQLGWLGGGNQIGEIAALQLGYFEQEGLDFKIQPGGPNNDGIAIVASGRYEVGQVSSSPSLMLAVSQDIPIKCFAVSAQQHPYAFFSLKQNPVRSAADFRGKKVGIQATGADFAARVAGEEQHRPEGCAGRHHRLGNDAADDRTGGCRSPAG